MKYECEDIHFFYFKVSRKENTGVHNLNNYIRELFSNFQNPWNIFYHEYIFPSNVLSILKISILSQRKHIKLLILQELKQCDRDLK
jgi:hypothetical protein